MAAAASGGSAVEASPGCTSCGRPCEVLQALAAEGAVYAVCEPCFQLSESFRLWREQGPANPAGNPLVEEVSRVLYELLREAAVAAQSGN